MSPSGYRVLPVLSLLSSPCCVYIKTQERERKMEAWKLGARKYEHKKLGAQEFERAKAKARVLRLKKSVKAQARRASAREHQSPSEKTNKSACRTLISRNIPPRGTKLRNIFHRGNQIPRFIPPRGTKFPNSTSWNHSSTMNQTPGYTPPRRAKFRVTQRGAKFRDLLHHEEPNSEIRFTAGNQVPSHAPPSGPPPPPIPNIFTYVGCSGTFSWGTENNIR
jgi:hypothetical protein